MWQQLAPTLEKKVALYCEERVQSMLQSHRKFCKTLSGKNLRNLDEWVSRMALELSPPKLDVGMDRELFDIVINENGGKIVCALNPIARKALLMYHGHDLITPLSLIGKHTFERKEVTNNVKERVVELYIITRMAIEVYHEPI
jgi:hypothetical protein